MKISPLSFTGHTSRTLAAVAIFLVFPFLYLACSGSSTPEGETTAETGDDGSLNALPPGETGSASTDEQEVDSHINTLVAEPQAFTSTSSALVYYRTEDSNTTNDCTFLYPFTLSLSSDSSDVTFQEREDTATTYPLENGLAFHPTIEDDTGVNYTCYVGLSNSNTTASIVCNYENETDNTGGQCASVFLADSDKDGQLAKTTFTLDESATTCTDFTTTTVSLEIASNRANLYNADGSKTQYPLTGFKAFRFMDNLGYGTAEVDGAFTGFIYDLDGDRCQFASYSSKVTTPNPNTSDPLPATDLDCSGTKPLWYGPCMVERYEQAR